MEIRQTVPRQAIRGNGISVSSTLPPSQGVPDRQDRPDDRRPAGEGHQGGRGGPE